MKRVLWAPSRFWALSILLLPIGACKQDGKAAAKGGTGANVTVPLTASPQAGTVPTEAPLRSNIESPPQPPTPKNEVQPAPAANLPPDEVLQGPTKGEASPESLAKALVDAAKRRDTKAFAELTVCGRDIGVHFHAGVQLGMRQTVGRLQRKFATYTQQIPADGELLGFKPGLRVDFRKGQGAISDMPGFLSSDFLVKAGATPRTLPLGRIVQIEGRWKILDF